MHVNKTLETPEGAVKFEGELEPKEVDFVIRVGLNYLLQMGALPFTKGEGPDDIVVDMDQPLQ